MKGIYECQVCGEVFVRELHPVSDVPMSRETIIASAGCIGSMYIMQTIHECSSDNEGIVGIAKVIGFAPDEYEDAKICCNTCKFFSSSDKSVGGCSLKHSARHINTGCVDWRS